MKRLPYREIAEKAGVSVSTVYRAVSVPDPSSQSCRKVRDAISALGGNPMDYGLSDRRGIIVFVSPYPSNPFYAPISHRHEALSGLMDMSSLLMRRTSCQRLWRISLPCSLI